jgi:hypothetical protein
VIFYRKSNSCYRLIKTHSYYVDFGAIPRGWHADKLNAWPALVAGNHAAHGERNQISGKNRSMLTSRGINLFMRKYEGEDV